ncbi:uncharacterized protein HMPREF1120_01976 [Exophiala dermatitidis NIH/UT8656]|uniref:Uncharacterized protein n=1 Tax=Exophiala dermatitidis (strain ATCC 34100 / CBS 525.76 / NIH/UT8656) TaxID=858893 RepID=H6BQH6_EXODN|nr:uncharacterized protein HMPREF1120_01976 [Exophiala dermatitidis NIH/UT8656]EHY53793.1 hypothetical protein HMPREF1120_01976 [Exophiala dermatitidis NIH/UT8656]
MAQGTSVPIPLFFSLARFWTSRLRLIEQSFEEVGKVSVSASRDPKFFHSLANLIFLNFVTEPLPKVRVQGREDRFEDKASGDLCAFCYINRYFFRQIWENYHHCDSLENQLRKDDR